MDEDTLKKVGPVWIEDYKKGLSEISDLKAAEDHYFTTPMANHAQPFDFEPFDKMLYGLSPEEAAAILPSLDDMGGLEIGPWHEWRPCGLYHEMLEKVTPFAAKGVIWYQGESDVEHPEIYASMLEAMINLWRKKWNSPLAFVSAQLAPFGKNSFNGGGELYPIIREQQASLVGKVENYYLVSTGDVGNEFDIHPKEKQPVGNRMALTALNRIYDINVLCDGPQLQSADKNDNTIVLHFNNADDGLKLKGNAVEALHVLVDETEEKISTLIKNNHIIVTLDTVHVSNASIRVEYAQTPYYNTNVYNSAGFPIMPFTVTL